ncbi:MAG TPA: YtxH domain-containing protein [Terrimesophilobacter sp.]|nr:YtxH domain-containing protein [Terrimesophilobacter sp.]
MLLLVGLGVGYVLGARAGRGRYEQIKRGWLSFWNSPGVQTQVHNAQEFVSDKAPEVVEFVSDTAKKFVSRGDSKPKAAAKSSAKPTSKATAASTSKSSTRSSASGSK